MNIISGKLPVAKRIVFYGAEGIGKSTLASQCPDPLFIDTEGSTNHMDVTRFDAPSSWHEWECVQSDGSSSPADSVAAHARHLVLDSFR